MPEAPSWINKVNYIIDYWQNPCHAPLLVYLELAREPAGEALLTWFSFGLDDVIRGAVRPSRALGSNVRNRRGKVKERKTRWARTIGGAGDVWRKTPGLGEDLGGWIGKQIPGANEIKGRSIHQLTRYLWMLDDVAQRALFWLMIADLTVDFAYEWATALNESIYCHRDKAGGLYANGPGSSCGGIIICNTVNAPNLVYQDGDCDWHTQSGHVGPGNWNVTCGMTVTNFGATPRTHYQEALVDDLYSFGNQRRADQIVQPGQVAESVATWHLNGPGTINIHHCALGGTLTGGLTDVAIFGGP